MTKFNNTHAVANLLLDCAKKELDECAKYDSDYGRDSWLACMVTSRILSNLAKVLIGWKHELEKANGQEETGPQL